MSEKDHCDTPYENLGWLDIETTGLDPNGDAILEIGCVITTTDLEFLASKSFLLVPTRDVCDCTLSQYVMDMHDASGLWTDLKAAEASDSLVSIESATQSIVDLMGEYDALGSPMCGSTVSFDRGFLKIQAPALLSKAFHYRNIDVSTLKNVFAVHFPGVPKYVKPESNHRAIGDLYDSIAEYQHYIGHISDGCSRPRWMIHE